MKSSFKMFCLILIIAKVFVEGSAYAASGSLNLCIKGTKILAKARCSKGEQILTTAGASAASKRKCFLRVADFSGTGTAAGTAGCADNESFMSHGGYLTSGTGKLSGVELRVYSDTDEVGGVTYTYEDPQGGFMEGSVQAWCCR